MVSSAECSSDDEDFAECEGHAGGLGQLNFACLSVVTFHLQLRIRSSKHRLPPMDRKSVTSRPIQANPCTSYITFRKNINRSAYLILSPLSSTESELTISPPKRLLRATLGHGVFRSG